MASAAVGGVTPLIHSTMSTDMDVSEDLPPVTRAEALAAVERRTQNTPSKPSAAQVQQDREFRQKFRRLIDPGIVRPNSEEQAHASIKILLTLSENLLRDPENPKFQRFKPTNTMIKRNLVDAKGALEYAIEMGFRPVVESFQPYYDWNIRHLDKLRVGTLMLQEHMNRENERLERTARSKDQEAAARQANADKVKLAFIDDRMAKEHRDEMERQARAGRKSVGATKPPKIARPSRPVKMPGAGVLLNGEVAPPDYNSDEAPSNARNDDDDDEADSEDERAPAPPSVQ